MFTYSYLIVLYFVAMLPSRHSFHNLSFLQLFVHIFQNFAYTKLLCTTKYIKFRLVFLLTHKQLLCISQIILFTFSKILTEILCGKRSWNYIKKRKKNHHDNCISKRKHSYGTILKKNHNNKKKKKNNDSEACIVKGIEIFILKYSMESLIQNPVKQKIN